MTAHLDWQSLLVFLIVGVGAVRLVLAFVRPFARGRKGGCSRCNAGQPADAQQLLDIEPVREPGLPAGGNGDPS